MSETVKEKLEANPIFDHAIIEHHFTSFMRDYDVIIGASIANEFGCRYRFTHCVLVQVTSALGDEVWRRSWSDELTDFERWQQAGSPEGFVWGVRWSNAYPGLSYVDNCVAAREWSERLGHLMHEVTIETNCQNFRLIFHDVNIGKIAIATPNADQLTPL